MSIPIRNIYYLLCYAWDKLEERDSVSVDAENAKDMLDLLARILISGTRHLLLRGLDQSYRSRQAVIPGIKGKLNVPGSIGGNLLAMGKTLCEFDEFSVDVLHNQVLKTSVHRLIRTELVEDAQRVQLQKLYRRLGGISEIPLSGRTFEEVHLHRNNHHYRFPLKVCELIHRHTRPSEGQGTYEFQDFSRNHLAMAALFEEFVRKFLKVHFRGEFHFIGRETIRWKAEGAAKAVREQIPVMQTDVTMISEDRKIIIDPKFYHHAVTGQAEKLNPGNLYQLFAYLKNQENSSRITQCCEGILLYPKTGKPLDLKFTLEQHPISVKTIDLDQPWRVIEVNLLELLN